MQKKTIIKRSSDVPMKNIMDKRYSEAVFNLIKDLRDNKGLSYGVIAEKLTKEGYVSASGGKLTQPLLTRFMTNRGYRVFEHKSKTNGAEAAKIPVSTDFERDIIKILQADFPEATKRRLVAALATAPTVKSSENNSDS
jgi:multimeric flavodoxin WrbA